MRQPRTSIPEIVWPAIPDAQAALLMALLHQLGVSERLSSEQISARQMSQAGVLIQHAYRTVPYYQQAFRSARFRPRRHLTLEQFSQAPILSRAAIQSAGDRLLSSATPKSHGDTSTVQTSGSTGQPISVVSTEITGLFWRAFTLRDHLWHQRKLSGTLAAIRSGSADAAPPDGKRADVWGPATGAVYGKAPAALLSIQSTAKEQAAWLKKVAPSFLITYPSNLTALLRFFREQGKTLPSLHSISTVGEVVDPALRQLALEVFKAPIKDMYTCQEAGYLALQCPQDSGNYHVQSESVLLEVLDENNAPCQPGETGRVVLTTLHNFAMPLIRYEVGDYAIAGGVCSCGRGLPTLKRVLGRVRNMVRLPDGSQHWPFLGENLYREIAPVEQYQLVQKSLRVIEALMVVSRPLNSSELSQLTALLQKELRYSFDIQFKFVEQIERSKSGKFEDFRSELE